MGTRDMGNEDRPTGAVIRSIDFAAGFTKRQPRRDAGGGDGVTPSIAVYPFHIKGDSDTLKFHGALMRERITLIFKQWRWLHVDETCADSTTHKLYLIPNARYALRGSLGGDNGTVSVAIAFAGPDNIAQHIEFQYQSHAEIGVIESVVRTNVLYRLKNMIFQSEEEIGIRHGWKSDDARQSLMWAYVLWSRSNQRDWEKARGLAEKVLALDVDGQDNFQPRAHALLVLTYIDGISYLWETEGLDPLKNLSRHAGMAFTLDQRDSFVRAVYSDFLLYHGKVAAARDCLSRDLDSDTTSSLQKGKLGLAFSYHGEFKQAEKVLEELIKDSDTDRYVAHALQYLGQCKCLLGKFEEGVGVARQALAINNRSFPARRTLAVNLASMGLVSEARREFFLVFDSHFTSGAYSKQPWQRAAWHAMQRYVEAMELAGAPKG